jgi:hypothetical protein
MRLVNLSGCEVVLLMPDPDGELSGVRCDPYARSGGERFRSISILPQRGVIEVPDRLVEIEVVKDPPNSRLQVLQSVELPPPVPGTLLLVSSLVAFQPCWRDREDLRFVRARVRRNGRLIGVVSLGVIYRAKRLEGGDG